MRKIFNNNFYLFWLVIVFGFQFTQAAPHPGVGSSLLSNPNAGLFLAPHGFKIKSEGTDWIPREVSKSPIFESYRLGPKDNKNQDAFLSVRIDKLESRATLETYAKKWLRDYPQLGFELYGSKTISLQGSPGLVIDFAQKVKERQVRQVILQKGQKLAVFTCTDKKDLFSKTLINCNKIIRSFEWVE